MIKNPILLALDKIKQGNFNNIEKNNIINDDKKEEIKQIIYESNLEHLNLILNSPANEGHYLNAINNLLKNDKAQQKEFLSTLLKIELQKKNNKIRQEDPQVERKLIWNYFLDFEIQNEQSAIKTRELVDYFNFSPTRVRSRLKSLLKKHIINKSQDNRYWLNSLRKEIEIKQEKPKIRSTGLQEIIYDLILKKGIDDTFTYKGIREELKNIIDLKQFHANSPYKAFERVIDKSGSSIIYNQFKKYYKKVR